MSPRSLALARARAGAQAICALASAFFLGGCGGVREVGRTGHDVPIVQIQLRWSNVYLVQSARPLLVDAGAPGDIRDLENGLWESGSSTRSLKGIVLTHVHADHAGLAAELRRTCRCAIFAGEGDAERARLGVNDPLRPTGTTAALLKPFIPKIFPEFDPDTVVDRRPIDLAPWGVDGQIVELPGHTAGSLVVVLADHKAFVGDMMLGGAFGAIAPSHPREHYYQADPAQNRENVRTMLAMGVETFYLGHGGPVARRDVEAWLADSEGR